MGTSCRVNWKDLAFILNLEGFEQCQSVQFIILKDHSGFWVDRLNRGTRYKLSGHCRIQVTYNGGQISRGSGGLRVTLMTVALISFSDCDSFYQYTTSYLRLLLM